MSPPKIRLFSHTMPPKAAMIWGSTMNMLKTPIPTPIFWAGTAPDNMAYGMLRMLPQEMPTHAKLKFNHAADSGDHKDIEMNPMPPMAKLTK